MATGIFNAISAVDLHNNPHDPASPQARDIFFQANAALVTAPQDQLELKAEVDKLLYAIRRLFPDERQEAQFRPYFVQTLSAAQLGLAGPKAMPELARPAIASIVSELISSEGGRIKNAHLGTLSRMAFMFCLVCLLAYVVLRACAFEQPLHGIVEQMGFSPMILVCLTLVLMGCFIGVVLSYGIRTTSLTLNDLIQPDADRLMPAARLLFAGALSVVLALFLVANVVEIKIGGFVSTQVLSKPLFAFLLGVICGISELALPGSIGRKADGVLQSLK